MKKKVIILFLFSLSYLRADQQNLIILVDTTQQESIKKQDITATHQLIVALQQQAAPILVSVSLWKNIVDRKKDFAKKLHHQSSVESYINNLYQETNRQLKSANYNIDQINQKLSPAWYEQNYPQLAKMAQSELDQIKFNFLCYSLEFKLQEWSVYDAQTGMLLFVPTDNSLKFDDIYRVQYERDLIKHAGKKNHVIQSMHTYLGRNQDTWIIYLSGHGHPEAGKQQAHIAGMSTDDFSEFLKFLHKNMRTRLLVYSSCYAGGVHAVEPYKDMRLGYPIIVVALTDAPIYGFGFFEGVKLPPYNPEYSLTSQNVQVGQGLRQSATQQFGIFFGQAWSGLYDMNLVESVSQFFTCKAEFCSLLKIENIPLLRQAHDSYFSPMQDAIAAKLVQQATTSASIIAQQPLLLQTKKIKKIEMTDIVPIVSMLPGLQCHEIGQLDAHQISLSQIINGIFLALSDAQRNKNYLIHKLSCYNDLVDQKKQDVLTHFMLIQQGLKPKFLDDTAQAIISFKSGDQWYLAIWNDEKCSKVMILTLEQIKVMKKLEKLLQSGIDFQAHLASKKLIEFDAYIENKLYQQDLIELCLRQKICKKW